MSAARPTDPPPFPEPSENDATEIRKAAEILGSCKPTNADALRSASLPALLFYALSDGSDLPVTGMLRALRGDLAGIARLTNTVSEASAADLLSTSEHIGVPLESLVRRLDVTLELIDRLERGRMARQRVRVAKGGPR